MQRKLVVVGQLRNEADTSHNRIRSLCAIVSNSTGLIDGHKDHVDTLAYDCFIALGDLWYFVQLPEYLKCFLVNSEMHFEAAL